MKTRNFRDGTLIIQDGTAVTPNELEVTGCEGDLSFSESKQSIIIMRRGVIDSVKEGDEEAIPVSFTVKFEQWAYADGAATGISVADALKKRNGASAWVSVDTCAPYMVNLIFKMADPCTAGAYEVLTFSKFITDTLEFSEGNEYNTLRVTGRCISFPPVRTYETP